MNQPTNKPINKIAAAGKELLPTLRKIIGDHDLTKSETTYLLYSTMLGIEMANGKTHAEAKELMARLTQKMLEVPEPETGGEDVIIIKT